MLEQDFKPKMYLDLLLCATVPAFSSSVLLAPNLVYSMLPCPNGMQDRLSTDTQQSTFFCPHTV